jgi:hypothetical protein
MQSDTCHSRGQSCQPYVTSWCRGTTPTPIGIGQAMQV